MSEMELNSYRFLSGEDPSDEMLERLMKGMGQEAVARRKEANERLQKEIRRQRDILDAQWKLRLNARGNA